MKQTNRPADAMEVTIRNRAGASSRLCLALGALLAAWQPAHAGSWTALNNTAPGGVNTMLLLPDGTVMAEATNDSAATGWYRLAPDSRGSYINGSWSNLASMHDTRLFFSSDVMANGKVFVAGGEYGSGGSTAEVYDPVANTWTYTPTPPVNGFSDSISETLPNGNVLVAPVSPQSSGGTVIYNMASNSWSTGPTLLNSGYQDEASWVKLPDGSILTIDPFGTKSERYIPSTNSWVNDSTVPDQLYDSSLGELGAGILMPNGKVIFFGSTGHTAIYTPSGSTSPGSWVAGPDFPNGQGTPDAPAAMMPNGVILCATGPAATYNGPTSFYEYNPNSNSFTQVNGPTGTTDGGAVFNTRMLVLPDGNVLYSDGGSRLYEYTPSSGPVSSAKPTIANVGRNSDGSYQLNGYQLAGISEGAAYGDDAQMATDYPIVRLTNSSGNVWFARTYNWSDNEVMQGYKLQTTQFALPSGLPSGNYLIQVVTNGVASNAVPFPTSNELIAPETLTGGQSIVNNDIVLTMQPDGNLVAYNGSTAIWASNTSGHAGAYCTMQTDGNLVVYSSSGSALWATGTWGNSGAYTALQADGNIVVYSSGGSALWASGTSTNTLNAVSTLTGGQVLINGSHYFTMQTDGNLVEYNGSTQIWASNTGGHPGAYCTMQADGNLVVYSSSGSALWAAGTWGHPGAYTVLQSDGNVVVYSSTGSALWATGTNGK